MLTEPRPRFPVANAVFATSVAAALLTVGSLVWRADDPPSLRATDLGCAADVPIRGDMTTAVFYHTACRKVGGDPENAAARFVVEGAYCPVGATRLVFIVGATCDDLTDTDRADLASETE